MLGQSEQAGQGGAEFIKDTTTASFRVDVIAESARQPVLVDFWAPWCGPCKQLTPVIEKVIKAAGGKVKLVKMNIDEHPEVAGQLGVKSIPAVIAFQKGQPVDGFMGALPESQIKGFLERLVGPLGGAGEELIAEGEAALAAGDAQGGGALFSEALSLDPTDFKAFAGLARASSPLAISNRHAPSSTRPRPAQKRTPPSRPPGRRSKSRSRRPRSAISPPLWPASRLIRPIMRRVSNSPSASMAGATGGPPPTSFWRPFAATAPGTKRPHASNCCSSSRPGAWPIPKHWAPGGVCQASCSHELTGVNPERSL